MPLRCVCPNGHVLKVKDKLAGSRGTCPTCQAEFEIPVLAAPMGPPAASQAASSATAPPTVPPGSPASAVVSAAVEWRLAWADGQQFGPTVETVFAQWIVAGRVPPDALVWRTGWAEWRRVSEAAKDLPAPLPTLGGEATADSTPPGVTLPPPLPAEPAEDRAPTLAPLIAKGAGVGGTYALRRRREARRRRLFTIGLAVVCLALTAMLVGLMLTGPPEGAPVIPR